MINEVAEAAAQQLELEVSRLTGNNKLQSRPRGQIKFPRHRDPD